MERYLRNRLKLRQFRVFPYPGEAALAPLSGRRSRSGWKG